jgi:RNA polymerase sigma factor (sigma-70 family)
VPDQPVHPVVRHLRRLAAAPPGAEAGDQELLRRFTSDRDEAAFAALVRRHGPMVRDVARRLLGQESDVDDAFQAVFLVLARRAHSIRNRHSLAAFLHGIAYRTAQRARRDAARLRNREAHQPERHPADPAQEAAWRELCAALDAELFRLPEGQRAALVLCYLEGQTRDQAARQLGHSVRTLDRHLERGKERLRSRLGRRGLTLSGALLTAGLTKDATAAGVPAALVTVTIKAAALAAAGQVMAPGAVPGEVMVLAQGVLNAMLRTRLKVALVVVLALGLLGAGTGLLTFRAGAQGAAGQTPGSPAAEPPAAGGPPAAKQAADLDVCALLLIEEREPQLLADVQRPTAAGGNVAAFRRTQVVLLKSRLVLQAALRRRGVAELAVVKQKADLLAWLERNLRADLIDNTGVLRVSVAEGGAAERAALANAVAEAYVDEVAEADQRRRVQRLNGLRDLRDVQEKGLREKRQRLHELGRVLAASHSLQQEFDREDLVGFRKELQRVRLARLAAQARLNCLKRAGAKEGGKETVAKLEEEVAVLAEQETLLKGEIAPLAEAAEARARNETAKGVELAPVREEVAAAERIAKTLAAEVGVMEVELRAAPRVRLLQRAEAPRPGK